MKEIFRQFAVWISKIVGSAGAFVVASLSIIVWALFGPAFRFSDTWQLVMNTATSIVTFLIVFIIQNTQNRDSKTIQLKLDELILSLKEAHNEYIDVENLSDEYIQQLKFRLLNERKDQ
jgi:low affinity Fe/Cu permease